MISRTMFFALSLGLGAAAGCSGGTHEAPLSADAQPLWDRCQANLQRYCRDRSEMNAGVERECMRDWRARYAAAHDDAGRRTLVASYGCAVSEPTSGGTR